ncbi:MarR family winged helix-turn-helix transcriptional regulator [Streptosporangium roseum]|uniref:Regulatory protein n=1 Tax=Streptosporangium roseum (strain ATCC 12428 / DSM 43021 / JCM 3005 / KCTC 9067 / NCIMB 10171 / NRRL 2505 / NI 9100) TaxID=479432 RepID=D2BET9_STRRD|nr:MarR family winged helix-turn-helix transcriptional regulator [Streptosporangium roseum]ACZ84452.1 regulatory protein [Streptosporangium roseum DSM 43021]
MTEILDLMTMTHKALRAVAEESMRRHGLHLGQNLVLAALWEQDGRTPGELAALLNVTTPTVVKMATRMSASDLLVRRRDDADNRLVRLYLTDRGRALRGPVTGDRESLERHITQGLTGDELRALASALAKVRDNARSLGAPPADHTDEA